jgi:hypothetical protein
VKDGGVSYHLIVLGMVACFAIFMVLFIAGLFSWQEGLKAGFQKSDFNKHFMENVYSLILIAFMLVAMVLALTRQMGEAGWQYHSPWSVAKIVTYTQHRYLAHDIFRTQASFLGTGNVLNFGAYQGTFSPYLSTMYSLKMAADTHTRVRDVVKTVFLTLFLGAVIMVPMYVVIIHRFGFEHGEATSDWFSFWKYSQPYHAIGYGETPSFFNRIPPWVSVPIGVLIVGVTMYLRREYVGFPLAPVGIVITAGGAYFGDAYATSVIWLPIVIVFVVKRVIYKWFGVRFFHERVTPVVLFAMMGLMTGMIIYKVMFAVMGRGFLGSQ